MNKELIDCLVTLINSGSDKYGQQRAVIVLDLLWKLARKDYHGVCDCANDLRELHL